MLMVSKVYLLISALLLVFVFDSVKSTSNSFFSSGDLILVWVALLSYLLVFSGFIIAIVMYRQYGGKSVIVPVLGVICSILSLILL